MGVERSPRIETTLGRDHFGRGLLHRPPPERPPGRGATSQRGALKRVTLRDVSADSSVTE